MNSRGITWSPAHPLSFVLCHPISAFRPKPSDSPRFEEEDAFLRVHIHAKQLKVVESQQA